MSPRYIRILMQIDEALEDLRIAELRMYIHIQRALDEAQFITDVELKKAG